MEKETIELKIAFRKPIFPVIIISHDNLLTGGSIKTLALSLLISTPQEGKSYIPGIDSTGKEFWYNFDSEILSPGFTFKRWTKKRIIDLFNASSNPKKQEKPYSMKSISNKKLSYIIKNICKLIKRHS